MNNQSEKVKISDIAKKARVSAGTVDRVIHNRGEVAPKTREKVLKIIKEMKYQPDIVASTLASKKTIKIAAILPLADKNNPFWEMPDKGLMSGWDEIRHFGVQLEKFNFIYHEKESFEKQFRSALDYNPDGLILAPIFPVETLSYIGETEKRSIPIVFLNTSVEKANKVAFIGQDSMQSGRVGAHLLNLILDATDNVLVLNMINVKSANAHILSRQKGFSDFFSQLKQKRNVASITLQTEDYQDIFKLIQQKIENKEVKNRKTGIFVTNSKVFRVADVIEKYKIKNVLLAGYDLLPENIDHLRKGNIQFLIGQKPHEQGYKSLVSLFNAIVMKKEVETDQFLPIDIITKENLDFYLNHKK